MKQISDNTKMDTMSTNIFLVKPRMGSAKNPPYWDPAIRHFLCYSKIPMLVHKKKIKSILISHFWYIIVGRAKS